MVAGRATRRQRRKAPKAKVLRAALDEGHRPMAIPLAAAAEQADRVEIGHQPSPVMAVSVATSNGQMGLV